MFSFALRHSFLALLPVVLSLNLRRTDYTSVVVYGDSFSDNGNTYHLTNDTWPSNPAYYKGRFSNGPVWVEDLASLISSKLEDHAYGGATSDNSLVQGYSGANSTIPVPASADQVASVVAKATPAEMSSSLNIILIGANDIFFNTSLTAEQVTARISSQIDRLKKAGAKTIALASFPQIAIMPISRHSATSDVQSWTNFSTAFLPAIKALAVQNSFPLIDFYTLFQNVSANPASYGFNESVVRDSCLTGAYGETTDVTLCSNPDEYVFWDAYHPTKKMHFKMAEFAIEALALK